MRRAPIVALAMLAAELAQSASAAPARPAAAQIERGKLVFTRTCAPCHGQGPGDDGSRFLPGTNALTMRYKGERPGALELRTDLPAPTLRLFVRNGSGPMPMFRKTEVSDADIDAIAAYIADNAAKAKR